MLELDEVVRQNQVACLPFSRSSRAEAELFERYPELIGIIERGRRAKIDSFRLQSCLRDEENYYTNAGKARPVSRDDKESASKLQNLGPEFDVSSKRRDLKPQRSAMDLIFEMEEEEGESSTALCQITTPSYVPPQPSPFGKLEAASPSLRIAEISNSPNLTSPSGTPSHLAEGSSCMSHHLPETPPKVAGEAKVWGSSALDSPKLDMKEIMAQAYSNRVSTLSSGLANKSQTAASGMNSQAGKLSQKERKKQQQKQQLQQDIVPALTASTEELEQSTIPKPSPWRQTSTGQKVSLQDVLKAEGSASPSPSTETLRRQASNAPLTMRQTVPGNAESLRRSANGVSQHNSAPPQTRSTSTADAANNITPSQSPANIKDTSSPSIRSIRHEPPSVEPSLQLSMADILAQQQTEKDVIKDAVAKRSLQEIQEEQAFQEWWDEESRKAREAEEKAKGKTVDPSHGKSGKGRGKGRRASGERGRGAGKGARSDESQPGGSKDSEAKASTPRRGRNDRRSHGRAK